MADEEVMLEALKPDVVPQVVPVPEVVKFPEAENELKVPLQLACT